MMSWGVSCPKREGAWIMQHCVVGLEEDKRKKERKGCIICLATKSFV
jgi:hypothetical protein